MGLARVDIETIVIGGGPVASLLVLRPRPRVGVPAVSLPIRLGAVEASSIGMGVEARKPERPMTHDLLQQALSVLGATVTSVVITGVEGTTFFAQVNLTSNTGRHVVLDARPSDAVALAVRTKSPVFVDDGVLEVAGCPDFGAVRHQEEEESIEEFGKFVETLSPGDFLTGDIEG
ncbi:bifunctional nuclease family protein [Olsenella sp. YH-ols2217]|uniref:Bifunctional nuclease family protein n=1 Tax=Kribbibacterium absianum TaxID=3044210 RepID=A0ABT6ZJJ9_9ACTN|nr:MULTISPECIES: bifunctional nuclease family protein [unclassified Olsenella]MDJ1122789.1 bifunctional nuclease family protein [Olsenella sp. YH-ols2216]MDJ1129228.1 bifunctional nuclease family protein [Olsenella sp. YH-ols2217]